jgi:hypothetical protein
LQVLKSKVAIYYGYSPGFKIFNPEEVEHETKQCVVNSKIGRNAPYTIPTIPQFFSGAEIKVQYGSPGYKKFNPEEFEWETE